MVASQWFRIRSRKVIGSLDREAAERHEGQCKVGASGNTLNKNGSSLP